MENRYLRAGLATSGQLYGEKVVPEHRDITIGCSAKADYVIPVGQDTPLAAQHVLFRHTSEGYFLQTTEEMTGSLASDSETPRQITDLSKTADRKNGFYQIPLGDNARGMIKIGQVKILFQVLEYTPPAERAKRAHS